MAHTKIAITGGIGTGKSTVARMFAELGAVILDADEAARAAVEPDSPCYAALHRLLGPGFFDDSGHLIRQRLRDRIIEDPPLREKVNSILHPFILASLESQWRACRIRDPGRIVLFDIPLLFEIHFDSHFDTIILAYVPPALQIQRLMRRDGLTHDQAVQTLAMQWPIDRKREKSHLIVDNSGSLEETREQVRRIWRVLTGRETTKRAGSGDASGTPPAR